MEREFDTIIFDLDGTLWDSTVPVTEAWNQAVHELGLDDLKLTVEQVCGTMGLSFEEIFAKLFPTVTKEEQVKIGKQCELREGELLAKKGGTLYPGVIEGLGFLKSKYRLMVVSNCQKGYIENFIKHAGLEGVFEDIECYGNTQKPKSWNIQNIVERNDVKLPVYIGDTVKDESSAKEAGVPFIFASWGFGEAADPEGARLYAEVFADLVEFFY